MSVMASSPLPTSIAYTKDRKQFGESISSFQGVKVEAARLMVYSAAARAERGETNLGFISAASKCLPPTLRWSSQRQSLGDVGTTARA